jgi:pyridoxamine 5'-phosphate oxidase
MSKLVLHDLRVTYNSSTLLESEAAKCPLQQFTNWFNEAKQVWSGEVNGMTLSTRSDNGVNARIVLLKQLDSRGFVFFTNYQSQKSLELTKDPRCSLLFWWGERSVRIQGQVEKLSSEENDEYYNVRPYESRIGAWTSKQSSVLTNREELDEDYRLYQEKYPRDGVVPRPDFWGGWRVIPISMEFWQGRPSRLHDRLLYERECEGKEWNMVRLSP